MALSARVTSHPGTGKTVCLAELVQVIPSMSRVCVCVCVCESVCVCGCVRGCELTIIPWIL